MKALPWILIILLLTSCGSHKSALRKESSTETLVDYSRKDTTSVNQSVDKTEVEEATEATEEVTIVYDTSKPVNPTTGKPPVLSETKKTTKKEVGKKVSVKEKTQVNASTGEQTTAKKKEVVSKVEDKRKDETTVPKQIEGLIWAVVALIVVAASAWLIIRNKPKKGDN